MEVEPFACPSKEVGISRDGSQRGAIRWIADATGASVLLGELVGCASFILNSPLLPWCRCITDFCPILFRRRLSAEGAKPESNNRWKSDLGHVCGWVGGWVCMVFGIISRTKARSAINEIPNCRSPERALLRHHIIGVRPPTSARRAKLPK